MPTFGRIDDLLVASYISGPSHIWLGIAFSASPIASPKIVVRPAIGDCCDSSLDSERIQDAVTKGIQDAGIVLSIERIEYVANDSPRYDIYRHCARRMAEREIADKT
jgi:hypothetical protein